MWTNGPDTLAVGTFVGAFCSTGCTQVGAPVTMILNSQYGYVEDNGAGFGRVYLLASNYPGTSQAENIHLLSDSASGNTIWGRVYWARVLARNPPTYSGTFVAHRRLPF